MEGKEQEGGTNRRARKKVKKRGEEEEEGGEFLGERGLREFLAFAHLDAQRLIENKMANTLVACASL